MFTILIIAFHSGHLLTDLVKSIDNNISIVILDNSQDYNLKNELAKLTNDYNGVNDVHSINMNKYIKSMRG